jgi:hypothetical protein
LDDTIEFYNLQAERLGKEFFEEVDFTFNRIKENPKLFPRIHKKMRKAKTNRFPFNIFFIDEFSSTFIIGIFHSSRNPNIVKKRYRKK